MCQKDQRDYKNSLDNILKYCLYYKEIICKKCVKKHLYNYFDYDNENNNDNNINNNNNNIDNDNMNNNTVKDDGVPLTIEKSVGGKSSV